MKMTLELGVFVFIIQFLACIIKGLVGFGNPLFSNPIMAMRLDNSVITPTNLPIDWSLNAYLVIKNRKFFKWKTTIPIAALLMVGVVPGTFFLKVASPWILKAVLGVLIIGLGIEMWTRDNDKVVKLNPIAMIVISIVSGFTAGLFGINMIILAYFERTARNRNEFRSNVCFVYLLENTFRIILYAIMGIFSVFTIQLSVISMPAALLGLFVGGRIDNKLNETTIKKIVIIVFILGGLSILVKAIIFKV